MNEFKAQMELSDFLTKHPHLIPQQNKITLALSKLESSEDRLYYLSVAMTDSFYELKENLAELDTLLKGL